MVKAKLLERIDRGLKGKRETIDDQELAKEIAADFINEDREERGVLITEVDKIKATKVITQYYGKKDLATQILNVQPLLYDKNKIWWCWNKQKFKWMIVDETDILNFVDDLSLANTIKAKEKMEILEAIKQRSRKIKPKPIKLTWLQFHNEIFDIKTGEIFVVTPKYFATNPIPYKLHPEKFEDTPTIDKIFEEWVGKEYVKTLYEIIAYCMIQTYTIHRIFCLIGGGLNGKSCFLNLLRKFIGVENCCSTELDTLISSRFEVTRLHKKLVCQMGETNFNEIKKTSILKKLSGGDLIGFEYKNKNPFEENNYAKIIIATNNLPTTTDKTIGFYRRWLIIPFNNQFSEKKDILNDIPEEEYESLALKCTSILNDLMQKREFYNEGTIEMRKQMYEEKSDFLQKFLDEFTIKDSDNYITKADFYKKFVEWCKETNNRVLAENSVGKKMKEKDIEPTKKYMDWMYDGKGGQLYVWEGIKWK